MAQKPKSTAAPKKTSKGSPAGGKSRGGSGSGGMSQMSAMMQGRVTGGGLKSGSKGK